MKIRLKDLDKIKRATRATSLIKKFADIEKIIDEIKEYSKLHF